MFADPFRSPLDGLVGHDPGLVAPSGIGVLVHVAVIARQIASAVHFQHVLPEGDDIRSHSGNRSDHRVEHRYGNRTVLGMTRDDAFHSPRQTRIVRIYVTQPHRAEVGELGRDLGLFARGVHRSLRLSNRSTRVAG
ncbi:hypothetical protein [Cryptosporangium japonicum]|uniref:hypothetical protein n=1 Tax=Cryptosporangium japonicum TaxID=80872 RepID=UPI003CD07293